MRELFTRNGWFNVYDFPCNSEWPTWPNEITKFQDGVQYWINPRLVDNIPDGARVYYTADLKPDTLTNVNTQENKPLFNEKITARKIIKYLLPYGIVRLIQRRRK